LTGDCEDRTCAREAKEYSLLEAVSRKRLVKIQQALNDLAGVVVISMISGRAVITCTYGLCV
jgi:hypothetical protein